MSLAEDTGVWAPVTLEHLLRFSVFERILPRSPVHFRREDDGTSCTRIQRPPMCLILSEDTKPTSTNERCTMAFGGVNSAILHADRGSNHPSPTRPRFGVTNHSRSGERSIHGRRSRF